MHNYMPDIEYNAESLQLLSVLFYVIQGYIDLYGALMG